MLADLIEECEDCFSFKDNLLILMTLLDVLNSTKHFKEFSSPETIYPEEIERYKVVEVKLYIAPMIDDAIARLIRLLSSEERILSLIYNEDFRKFYNWHEVCGVAVVMLEMLLQSNESGQTPKHVLTAILLRAKISNLLIGILLLFHDLAGPELAHSFKLYKSIVKSTSSRQELFGGIVYFLYVVCFETFTAGLNDFLRISLNDLEKIIDLDPTLSLWNPELRLIRIILELHNRCDQNAIDCLLQFMNFEIGDISEEFSALLNSSLEAPNRCEIPVKLIKKFGNINLVELFNNSFEFFRPTNCFSRTDHFIVEDLRQTWMKDFVSLLQYSKIDN